MATRESTVRTWTFSGGLVLPDLISPAVLELLERVAPSVVQIESRARGGGAGVIWDASGLVLTNYHVVAHARGGLRVALPGGRTLDAEVRDAHPAYDLALLAVAADDLPAAPAGDSTRLRVGELVFAIGHPWGQPNVVTAGIVSGLGQLVAPGRAHPVPVIQTDVRLAPGNSGGPLLNAHGEVVGLNAMIFGGDLAVAIPSAAAREWLAGRNDRPAPAPRAGDETEALL